MIQKILGLLLATSLTGLLSASDLTPTGVQLAERYDAMDVEHHWLPGHPVDWRSGDSTNGKPGKTHCSAFVASACERMGIYILRPPEHAQKNLANAQWQWLENEGKPHGWKPTATPFEAQRLANEGQIVVAVFQNPDSLKPGHIALIRPSGKPESTIRSEGPQITQAGGTNDTSTSLAQGFRRHPGAWHSADDFSVRFFTHPPSDQ